MMNEIICKGDWYLGTACGQCRRCLEDAKILIPKLVVRDKLAREAGEYLEALAIACKNRDPINPILIGGSARMLADRLRV